LSLRFCQNDGCGWCLLVQLEELETQKRLRTEMIQMEDTLSQVRREYDLLRIEFEQMLAANEQTGEFHLVVNKSCNSGK